MIPDAILTAAPDFVDLARLELQAALPGSRISTSLAPGVMILHLDGRFWELAESWRRQPPIFVRHLFPIHCQTPTREIARLITAVRQELFDRLDPTLPFSVQTRIFGDAPHKPFDINQAVATAVQEFTQTPLDVRQPVQIISVNVTPAQIYLGLSLAAHNLSHWAGGMRRFAREAGQISRAEFKLLEALEQFQIKLPARGITLDLGAAPGGWTRVLRQKEQYVTAVDPGQLHPSLQPDKMVRHKRMTAETYLADDPDTFDLIVNDMRQDARDSARLMVSYAPFLVRHGNGLVTLKLPKEKRLADGRWPLLDHTFNILQDAYHLTAARQLFHNRSEITVYLTKKESFS